MKLGTLHTVSLVGVVAFPTLGVINGSQLTFYAGIVTLIAVVVAAPFLRRVQRPKVLTYLVHVLTVIGLGYSMLVFRTSRVDSVLIVVLLGVFNRFVLRAGQRDDLIVIGASAVLVAVVTTIAPGIAFLPLVLGFLTAALMGALCAMKLGIAESDSDLGRRQVEVDRLSRQPIKDNLGRMMAQVLLLTIIGAVIMTAFPRHKFAYFLRAGAFLPVSSAADSMEMTTGGVTGGADGAVAIRVNPAPALADGALEGMYARVYVLDAFDGLTWSQGPHPRIVPVYERKQIDDPASPTRVEVTIERPLSTGIKRPVPVLGRARPALVMARAVSQGASGTLVVGTARSGRLKYYADLGHTPSLYTWRIDRFDDVPRGVDPRVTALAERLFKNAQTEQQKIDAVLTYFAKGYVYSLEPLPGETKDPLVRFLFEAKQGHCELYAGAVALLLRIGGVRSRVATGYYGGWWNDVTRTLEFTSEDAHAWVEVHDWNEGWRWVDATPPSARHRRKGRRFSWFSDYYELAERWWYNNVLSFDDEARRAFLADLSDDFSEVGSDAAALLRGDSGNGGGPKMRSVIIGILALLLFAGIPLVLLLRRKQKRLRPVSLGHRLRVVLGAEGDTQTLHEIARMLRPEIRPVALQAIGLYERLRFAQPDEHPPAEEVLLSIENLEKSMRNRA